MERENKPINIKNEAGHLRIWIAANVSFSSLQKSLGPDVGPSWIMCESRQRHECFTSSIPIATGVSVGNHRQGILVASCMLHGEEKAGKHTYFWPVTSPVMGKSLSRVARVRYLYTILGTQGSEKLREGCSSRFQKHQPPKTSQKRQTLLKFSDYPSSLVSRALSIPYQPPHIIPYNCSWCL